MALDLPLSAEQQSLQDVLQRFLIDRQRPTWDDLAETLGLGGVTVPSDAGGFGGGMIDIALVSAELGPALAGADWLSHAMACWLIGQAAPEHAILPDLAAGAQRAAIVCRASSAAMPEVGDGVPRGQAALVAGGAEADYFLIADDDAVLLVRARPDRVDQRHRIMHDGSVAADIGFSVQSNDVEWLASGARAQSLVAAANDMMLAARCAEAVGLMQRMAAAAADYLGQRQQFGRSIASFQVLRHRVADMQMAIMKAQALTEAAIAAIAEGRDQRDGTVSGACIEVADAVRIVGEGAVQIHGAMGLTEELELGGQFKRALAIAAALGPQAVHLGRFADAST